MRAIFISYRREDAEGQAGRLFTDLGRIFGPQSVFMDVAGLEAGRDFRRAIDEQVSSCGVLLAVIGKSWLEVTDASGRRRLEDPHDFVRLETAAALKRDIPVVPVLVHGAQMPRVDQLPPDMAELVYRSALEVTHARWESDVQVLANQLRRYVDVAAPASAPPAPAARAREPARGGQRALVAVAIAAAILLIGGYLWLGGSKDPATETASVTPVAAPLPTPSPADDRAAEAKAKADASRRAEAAAAAEHRARWPNFEFPPPNAGFLVFTIMPDGNPACASYDGASCLWGQKYDDIDFSKLKPLVCGAAHKAQWGATGYEDSTHWCSLARTVRPNKS
jgi:hypothetical protein